MRKALTATQGKSSSLGRAIAVLGVGLVVAGAAASSGAGGGSVDPVVAMVTQVNDQLRARGMTIAVGKIDFFTIGRGRPSVRLLRNGLRWVPGDPRRLAQGNDITYLVDQSDGATFQLTNAQTEPAIDTALATWQADSCLKKVKLVKRPDTGADPDIFDFFVGFGGFGNPFLADVVEAGWLPGSFFAIFDGTGNDVIAFSVTFFFLDSNGNPTDINGDNYADAVLNEVYYNKRFGEPATPRAGNPWGIGVSVPGIDVQAVALHENGHSLGLDHFGPPPAAVMNNAYPLPTTVQPTDHAGLCALWGSWPNP